MLTKQKILEACAGLINEKINFLKKSIHELMEGAESDSKSSAGDKHETARAMAQGEQEKLRMQLHDALMQRATLEKIPMIASPRITLGSLIKTNRGYLFLSVALGKINVEGIDVIVLSLQSPLGIKLNGLTQNETAVVNGVEYHIESIA